MDGHTPLQQLPELQSLFTTGSMVRIPPELNVPLTDRVSQILDTAPMRRLARISQLGLVSLVYPGATHSRLEHSLGVYRNALLFLQRLAATERFAGIVDDHGGRRMLLAALLHDVGHWPFCHPMEDMKLEGLVSHEQRARQIIHAEPIAGLIRQQWQVQPEEVTQLLAGQGDSPIERVLQSVLSGPIDVDKLDYLARDSLHAGVPYGRNFDIARLIASLTLHPELPRLAVTDKGRTAAEMLVFSRYIMFSEVYWHHTVRCATAMLQRAVFHLQATICDEESLDLDDASWIERFRSLATGTPVATLVEGLFGPQRRLYKQVASLSILDAPEIHRAMARRSYPWLVRCSELLAQHFSTSLGRSIDPVEIIVDAPPQKLEVDIDVDVVDAMGQVRSLGEVSPVAAVLSKHQFDHYVKRVRVFVAPELRSVLNQAMLVQAIETIQARGWNCL